MDGEGRRLPKLRGWVAVMLGILALLLVLLVIGLNFRIGVANTHAKQLLVIDTALGATLEPLDRATAKALGDGNSPYDMVVTSVATGGPADHAGIRVGDVIEAINGIPPGSTAESAATLDASPATIIVNRRGKRVKVSIQLRSPQPRE
jgi:S1-C subfamily serine protease